MDRLACVELGIADVTDAERSGVMTILRGFSPNVDPDRGALRFWLDGSGIEALFGSHAAWGEQLFAALQSDWPLLTVVVGFTRFGAGAIARCNRGMVYLETRQEEASLLASVPLEHAGIPERTASDLAKLGKRTLADLVTLPPEGVLMRFGPEVREVLDQVAGRCWDPLQPLPELLPASVKQDFDDPESNAIRLSFFAKALLRTLLRQVCARRRQIAAIELVLDIDRAEPVSSRIEPAEPTLDEVQLADLIRLRLEGLPLQAGVTSLAMVADEALATQEQLELFKKRSRRDLRAADRALARIRAEFGSEAVTCAALTAGHLPEARFALRPLERIRLPETPRLSGRPLGRGQLIRRIFRRPVPLQARPVVGPRGCHLRGMGHAPATRLHGPFVVSGGWWAKLVYREYYFAETEAGDVLWVFFDKRRRRWFLHGELR